MGSIIIKLFHVASSGCIFFLPVVIVCNIWECIAYEMILEVKDVTFGGKDVEKAILRLAAGISDLARNVVETMKAKL